MTISGEVELLSARRIEGWALDSDSDRPAVVDLCIEGHRIKKIKALRRRPAFSDAIPGGYVGFRFELHKSLLAYVRSADAVTIELNGVPLPVLKNELELLRPRHRKDPGVLPAMLNADHIITKQGEFRLTIRKDLRWQQQTFGFYERARERFRNVFGYDLFLVGGALLGYVRDRELIRSDDDLDTAYISKYTRPEDVREEMVEIFKKMTEDGELAKISTGRRYFLKWWSPDVTAKFDIFPAWLQDGQCVFSPGIMVPNGEEFVGAGLTTIDWYDHSFAIPARAEDLLMAGFGPGWKVYDPTFQWVITGPVRRLIRRMTVSKELTTQLNSTRNPLRKARVARVSAARAGVRSSHEGLAS